ncbi:helix-turn-helix domain-containing protein [Paenibacillus sp. PL91]|uniref:helix-turn-helix domain-containing protein n=1 Tax=Paenibacillus sp. PL91 TaxID=2729538 RepID=UPI00145D7453|nr:AraC family transcriptional regulator [Paenibacillus sp. PL91]MBC9200818.1 AraC family transcriptional regulator [Paenibacillus sp. PL91]
MDSFQEPIHYQNPQLCIKVWKFMHTGSEHFGYQPWHYHKEIEFILVLEGIHEMYTPSQAYKLHPGDVMVIGSSQLHKAQVQAGKHVSYIVLHVDLEPYFDPAMMHYTRHFMEIMNPLDDLNYLFSKYPHVQKEVGAILLHIHEEVMQKKKGYEIAVSMHIKHLLLVLLRNDDQLLLSAHEYVDADSLRPVVAYVEKHLSEKIEMAEVSRLAGMSYVYFSKYFKKKMGLSFTEFVNRKRISKAKRMLVTDNKSITSIAAAVGMENMAHFYELFKRFNECTPKQFKENLKGGRVALSAYAASNKRN